MKSKLLLLFFILLSYKMRAQDTLTIMYYNILNYSPTVSENANNLRIITRCAKPDLFAVDEISDDTSANHIVMYVLNTDSSKHYKKAGYTPGPDTDNMLFYNSDKVSLYSQDTILTDLRIINEYRLFYNNAAYISQHDTIFFYLYIAHLRSSTGTANAQSRLLEVNKFEEHLNKVPNRQNIFFGGDFNFYDNTEPALNTLIAVGPYQFFDPLDSIGNWHDNAQYSHIHTQSTRVRQFGGGATGGLDDRFDFIMVNNDIMKGSDQMKYIPGTYKTLGNDGHHLNDSLTAFPLDPEIPDSVTYALYNQSDHLPVIMNVYLNYDASIQEQNNSGETQLLKSFPNPVSDRCNITLSCKHIDDADISIFDMIGNKVSASNIVLHNGNNNIMLDFNNYREGVYFIKIKTRFINYTTKIIKVS
jgi:hypothetical protein